MKKSDKYPYRPYSNALTKDDDWIMRSMTVFPPYAPSAVDSMTTSCPAFGQGKLRDRLAMEEEMYGRDYPALHKPDVIYQEGEAEPQRLIGQRKVPMIESKTLALPKPEAIHLPDQSVLHLPNMSVSEIVSKKEQILKHSDMTPDDLNQLIIDKQSRKFETGEIEKPETAMRSEATRLGLEYVGVQEGGKVPLHLFTDPQNGSTFTVPEGESVDAALRGNRERFAPKTPVGETGDTTVQPKAEEATGGGKEQAAGVLGGEKEPWRMGLDEYIKGFDAKDRYKKREAIKRHYDSVKLAHKNGEDVPYDNLKRYGLQEADTPEARALDAYLAKQAAAREVESRKLTQKPHDNIQDVSVQKKVTKPSATESATTSTTSPDKQAEGSGKAKAGYVWIKEKQRPFTTYREILRGKNKGMYRVSVGGKGYLVDKGKIARFPEGALDKEISKANIAVDEQRAVTRQSLKKDHPDWSAQRVEDELAKTVRAGEEAGVSEANERIGKPVKKRLFEKKAVGAETASPTAKREPVAQKPKTVIESRQKKTPDLTATFPSSYSKTPREVLGKDSLWKVVGKDGKVVETEYATHPHCRCPGESLQPCR